MGHSTRTNMLSEGFEGVIIYSKCDLGSQKTFSNHKSANLWIRLHNKKCDICKNCKNCNAPIRKSVLQVIDLENKPSSIIM